jgi:hypothetical protein
VVAGETPEPPSARPRNLRRAVLAALAVMALALVWLVVQNFGLRSQLASERRAVSPRLPWSALFDSAHQTRIVLADSCLVLLEDVGRVQFNLNEYVSRSYLNHLRQYESQPALKSILDLIASRQYTSLADVGLVGKIMQLNRGNHDNVVISYARNLNIRDFKSDNFVLVGAPRANPWVELFEPKMNFAYEFDSSLRQSLFRNKSPRAGEMPLYRNGGADGKSNDSYAVVALLPNMNKTGNVLIIEGTNMEGTEAGVEFLTDPDFEKKAPGALRLKAGEPTRYWEILLKLRTVGGTSKDVEPIAYRVIN